MVGDKDTAESTIKSGLAGEAGHWYRKDGTPAYTIIGTNGKERNTTLRDARKYGLVPSVTTITRQIASPGLERWKLMNLLLASLTLPRLDGEGDDAFADRVMLDSQEQTKKAMQLGTDIHTALELAYGNQSFDIQYTDFVDSTQEAVFQTFGHQIWMPEKSFASEMGFGGKIDLHSPELVLDFKTKAFGPDDKVASYDEQVMQLAAYGNGLNLGKFRTANVFISTTYPGLVKIVEHKREDTENAWEMFQLLLQFWKRKNNI